MKWVFLLLIILVAPVVASWLKTKPAKAPLVWALLGFLPFVAGPWHLSVAPYSTPEWPGYVKGWEVGLIDAIAVAILWGTPGRWSRPTLMFPFLAYLFAVLIAIYQAPFGKLAFSYAFQLIRVFLVFLAVARVAASERGERAVLTGLVAGLVVQAIYAIIARAGGALQTGGTLGHQNLLGFVSHLVLMPAFALFLSGRWQRVAVAGLLAGLIAVILTASRATIAFSAVGLGLTLILSMAVHFTGRKAALGFAGFMLLAASVPLARASLDRRLETQKAQFFAEDLERDAFAKAARAMIDDHPMGVGPNHYVLVANTEGYSARAGVTWSQGSRATNVHNSYLLVTAETGYIGFVTMLLLIGSAIWYGFATAFKYRRQSGSEVLIGLACGLLAMSIHGLYEWMFVVYPTQYLFAGSLGLIAGLRGRYVRAASKAVLEKRAARKAQRMINLERPIEAAV